MKTRERGEENTNNKKMKHYFLNTEAVNYVDKEVTCVEKYVINNELLEDTQHS